MEKLRMAFGAVEQVLLELTPQERGEILAFKWSEMFAWWDEKPYYEDRPMIVRGLGLSHEEARFIWLLVCSMRDSGLIDCGPGSDRE